MIAFPVRAARVAVLALLRFLTNHGTVFSAAVAFNLLLSVIPILFLVFAVTSVVIGTNDLPFAQLSALLRDTFPYGASVLVPNLRRLIAEGSTFGIVGTVLLFVSSFSATDAVHNSLAVMMETPRRRRFRSGALFHVALVLALILLTAAAILVPPVWRGMAYLMRDLPPRLEEFLQFVQRLVSYAILPGLGILGGFASYKVLSPYPIRGAHALAGSLCFLAMVHAIRVGFVFYVTKFGRLSIIYGSLFGIVSFIIVAYLFAAAYLLGACVIGVLEEEQD